MARRGVDHPRPLHPSAAPHPSGARRWAGRWLQGLLHGVSLLGVVALGHGPDHEVILRLTEELKEHPSDVRRWLDRGERYRGHADWDSARADYVEALRLQPDFQPARVRLALVHRAVGQTNEALALLDVTLRAEPYNLLARSARADLYLKAGRGPEALTDYNWIVRQATTPRPELYLARARAQLLADTNSLPQALAGLEEGLRTVGPVPALESLALELEQRQGDTAAQLRRLERLTAAAERKERWLAQRGDVLRDAKRPAEAAQAYRAALAALGQLPERQRRTIATEDLRREVEAKLAALPAQQRGSAP
jgi:tetratricopeptide (TPR) repeat protein